TDCKLRFCGNCVVMLQGQPVCGPCKNFRIRGMSRPARVAPLAIVSLVVALVSGPVAFCLPFVGIGQQTTTGSAVLAVVFSIVGMALPVVGLVLAGLALREIETKPHVRGRSLAMTGLASGLAGIVWCAGLAVLTIAKQWQG